MDILTHRVDSTFQGKIVGQRVFPGETEFRANMERFGIEGIETRQPDPSIKGQTIVDSPTVRHEDRRLHRVFPWKFSIPDYGKNPVRPLNAWIQSVTNQMDTIIQGMSLAQWPDTVGFQESLADVGADIVCAVRPAIDSDHVVKMVISCTDIQSPAIIPLMPKYQ